MVSWGHEEVTKLPKAWPLLRVNCLSFRTCSDQLSLSLVCLICFEILCRIHIWFQQGMAHYPTRPDQGTSDHRSRREPLCCNIVTTGCPGRGRGSRLLPTFQRDQTHRRPPQMHPGQRIWAPDSFSTTAK